MERINFELKALRMRELLKLLTYYTYFFYGQAFFIRQINLIYFLKSQNDFIPD